MSLVLSMAAFALASSISLGPVNMVALSAGLQHGMAASLRYVTGATVGFTLLLLLTGAGLQEVLARWKFLTPAIQWVGAAFLVFLAYKLARDDGRIEQAAAATPPTAWAGASMQWLNPKAWLASMAGMGAYAAQGSIAVVAQFAAIYFFICYASIASCAAAGLFLRPWLRKPQWVRTFNRSMAALLVLSAVSMLGVNGPSA